jgi:hypothetical protein
MRIISVLFVVAACNQNKADRALSEFRVLRDRMCACTTTDCKRQVGSDLSAWEKTASGQLITKPSKKDMTEVQSSQIDPIEADIKRCRH